MQIGHHRRHPRMTAMVPLFDSCYGVTDGSTSAQKAGFA